MDFNKIKRITYLKNILKKSLIFIILIYISQIIFFNIENKYFNLIFVYLNIFNTIPIKQGNIIFRLIFGFFLAIFIGSIQYRIGVFAFSTVLFVYLQDLMSKIILSGLNYKKGIYLFSRNFDILKSILCISIPLLFFCISLFVLEAFPFDLKFVITIFKKIILSFFLTILSFLFCSFIIDR